MHSSGLDLHTVIQIIRPEEKCCPSYLLLFIGAGALLLSYFGKDSAIAGLLSRRHPTPSSRTFGSRLTMHGLSNIRWLADQGRLALTPIGGMGLLERKKPGLPLCRGRMTRQQLGCFRQPSVAV